MNTLTILGLVHLRTAQVTRIIHVPTAKLLEPTERNRYLVVPELAWADVLRSLLAQDHNDWALHPQLQILETDDEALIRRLPLPDPRLPFGTWMQREGTRPTAMSHDDMDRLTRGEGDLDATASLVVTEELAHRISSLRLWRWNPDLEVFTTGERLRPLGDGSIEMKQGWRDHAGDETPGD